MKSIDLRISIYASLLEVRAAILTSGGLERWFVDSADFLNHQNLLRRKEGIPLVGDAYWFKWADHSTETGEVLLIDDHQIQLSFGKDVTVHLMATGENPVVVGLVASLDSSSSESLERACHSLTPSLSFLLANLKSVLEYGHDLRDRQYTLSNLLNAA